MDSMRSRRVGFIRFALRGACSSSRSRSGGVNSGRGVYFEDEASGHVIELMPVVYGDPKEVDEALEKLKAEEEEKEEK